MREELAAAVLAGSAAVFLLLGFMHLAYTALTPKFSPRDRELEARLKLDSPIISKRLHHLPVLPDDLVRTLDEAVRVLRSGGRFVVVELWLTPFLRFVHAVCEVRLARRVWPKLDALATMNELEKPTYEAWLGRPREILPLLTARFRPDVLRAGWGKLLFVGRVASG